MMLFNRGETITVLRKGAVDWEGDSEGFSESHQIHNALVEYGITSSGDADMPRTDAAQMSGNVYMPMGSDVRANDRIELADGRQLRVYGKPWTYSLGLVRGTAMRFREH